jgi:hypothetical protein
MYIFIYIKPITLPKFFLYTYFVITNNCSIALLEMPDVFLVAIYFCKTLKVVLLFLFGHVSVAYIMK